MRDELIKIAANNKDIFDLGYRYVSSPRQVGDKLSRSFVWIGDERTNEELPGTCAFETLEACESYAAHSRGYILLIGGVRRGSGMDLPEEVIIEEAEVLASMPWN